MAISLSSTSSSGAINVNGVDVITSDASGDVSLRKDGGLLTLEEVSGLQALGVGQTWQNVKASRASGVTYTNTTGRPIYVVITATNATSSLLITIDGAARYAATDGTANISLNISAVIPNGSTYSINSASISYWSELR